MTIDPVPSTLHLGVLGPLLLRVDGEEVDVPGAKRRAVLIVLALADGAPVTINELIDVVWPADPPAQARAALHTHVSRVRAHLGAAAGRLVLGKRGYRLALERGELDVHLARDRLDAARELADDDPAAAVKLLESVRDLWRGRPFAELDDPLPVAARSVELTDLRREVDALLVQCALAAGDVDRAVRASARAHDDDPISDVVTRLRMQALAAAGRRTEALRLAADLRARLRDESGLAPTPELAELERAIAGGSLDPAAPGTGTASAPGATAAAVPVLATPIVGREAERAAIRRLLDDERLVCIVGTGGVGKTRLAVDVARRHDGDVHFVALAPVTDPDAVPLALAASLGLDSARGDVLDACAQLLAAGPRLLVLDNCEHLVDRARDVVTVLLQRCPDLTVLATSRQRLGLPSECAFRLGPLALPDAGARQPEQAPAMAVFLDRARRTRPGFHADDDELAAAVGIVRRLEGLPLAIELAAGRLSSLAIGDLRDRLDRSLDLLRAGRSSVDARHQTLRATIDWSYGLLPADRQRLLRHLAVFPDGVDLATAEQVAAEVGVDGDSAAALAHLVDASMLDAELDRKPRYRMLETLRSFGLEQLDATGERDAADERLVRWAVELVTWVDDTLHTPDESLADARLRSELANLRAAWTLALRRDALDAAITIIANLDDAAQWRELPEVWGWAQQLAEHPDLAHHPRAAAALATASDFAWLQGDLERATALATSALSSAEDREGRWRARLAVAVARLSHARFGEAADLALRAAELAPRPIHARLVAALAAAYAGNLERASAINDAGEPPSGITPQAEWHYTAGEIASIAGDDAEAEEQYRRAIDLAASVGSSFMVGVASVGLLTVLRRTGRLTDALRGYRDVLTYWENAGNRLQAWTTLRNLADLLAELGEQETARLLLVAAEHAPDAPAAGPSAWGRTAIDADGDPGGAATRAEAFEIAVRTIDRHLQD